MSQHRNTIQIPLKVSEEPQLHRCANDKSLRVMVFCAGDDRGPQDIAFPHQAELKVNGGEIKANLRGLKSKPGSTRPVDITSSLRLDKFSYQNNLEFTYALTVKVRSPVPFPGPRVHTPQNQDVHSQLLAITTDSWRPVPSGLTWSRNSFWPYMLSGCRRLSIWLPQ